MSEICGINGNGYYIWENGNCSFPRLKFNLESNEPNLPEEKTIEVDQQNLAPREMHNLRYERRTLRRWIVNGKEHKELKAFIYPKYIKTTSDGTSIELNIAIELASGEKWKLINAYPENAKGATVTNIFQEKGVKTEIGKVIITTYAASLCNMEQSRVPIVLKAEYEVGGKKKTEIFEVDYMCLNGDSYRLSMDAVNDFARLAYKYSKTDPLIKELDQKAGKERGTIPEEIAKLKKMIGFDPRTSISGIPPNNLTLSPSETAHYGGVCADWSILVGAYLLGRGFDRIFLLQTDSHVWICAYDHSGRYEIDFMGKPPIAPWVINMARVGENPRDLDFDSPAKKPLPEIDPFPRYNLGNFSSNLKINF